MQGKGLTPITAALIITVMVAAISLTMADVQEEASGLKVFNSKAELESFISTRLKLAELHGIPATPFSFAEKAFFPPTPQIAGVMAEKASAPKYSTTNIQVEGVDEADIVKTDGLRIYVASNRKVYVVKAYPPEEVEVLSHISLQGRVLGLFINRGRLVVFEEAHLKPIERFESLEIPPSSWYGVNIKIYDVEKPETPKLAGSVFVEGRYLASRMLGDYVYTVSTQPLRKPIILPRWMVNGEIREIPPSKIYYSEEVKLPVSYTIITAVNVFDAEAESKAVLTGYASCIYVSRSSIYVAIVNWAYPKKFNGEVLGESTELHRIAFNGLKMACEASGRIPGRILNQFSMDEFQGYFRVATTTGHVARTLKNATSQNYIYILKAENLEVVGRLEGLAPGEQIHSARFIGERCYLVTFRKVDPLFTIDLSNPEKPRLLGELKIPGYSDYLHPYDENHLIGVGKEAIPAERGDFAWYQGVKISLFDVSDVNNPREVDTIIIGDRGTETPVLRDHHALLFDRKRNLLVIPILEAKIFKEKYSGEIPPWMHGEYVFQGAYVFHVTPEGIEVRGKITHLDGEEDLLKSGFHFTSKYEIKRSLYIDEVLYTVSSAKIKANSLTNLNEISEISLQ